MLRFEAVLRHIAQPERRVDKEMVGKQIMVPRVNYLILKIPSICFEIINIVRVVTIVIGVTIYLSSPLVVVEPETGQ